MEEKYDFKKIGEKGEGSEYTDGQKREMKEEQEARRRELEERDSHQLAFWHFRERTAHRR